MAQLVFTRIIPTTLSLTGIAEIPDDTPPEKYDSISKELLADIDVDCYAETISDGITYHSLISIRENYLTPESFSEKYEGGV